MMRRTTITTLIVGGILTILIQMSSQRSAATASVVDGGTASNVECAVIDGGAARLDNGSFVIFGEPIVGVTQNASTAMAMSGIYCLEEVAPVLGCPFSCGDLNGDAEFTLADFGLFQQCFQAEADGECFCADLNADETIDLVDFGLFVASQDKQSGKLPPNCP